MILQKGHGDGGIVFSDKQRSEYEMEMFVNCAGVCHLEYADTDLEQ